MNSMKKLLALTLAGLMLTIVSGFGTAHAQQVFRVALVGNDEHQFTIGMRHLDELLQERSDGRMRLELFTNAVLGGDREAFEGVIMGSIDMSMLTSDGVVPAWIRDVSVLSIPYLFPTREDAYNALDNFLNARLAPLYEAIGIKHLGFGELGFRHFTNNRRPIVNASDMDGLIIRVQEAPIWFALCDALGAVAMPIAFPELYTALQQGVVDGQENPLGSIVSMRFFEVQRYLSLNGHTYAAGSVIMNLNRWNSLSAEDQAMFQDAVNDMVVWQRARIAEMDDEHIRVLLEHGIEIVKEPDIASFVEATRNIADLESVQALFDNPSIIQEVRDFLAGSN